MGCEKTLLGVGRVVVGKQGAEVERETLVTWANLMMAVVWGDI